MLVMGTVDPGTVGAWLDYTQEGDAGSSIYIEVYDSNAFKSIHKISSTDTDVRRLGRQKKKTRFHSQHN